MPLNIGTVLSNRYRIVQQLGQGGSSTVYRGWDINQQVRCAIQENTAITDESKRQFFREAQVLAGLSHANLVRVTDHFLMPSQGQYLVMELVDGEDLGALLAGGGKSAGSGPVAEETLLPWIGQVLDALHYLHSQNPPVLHGDIRPSNIRVTSQGKAVLVNFGVGRMPAAQSSPGIQTDIYALGATMYKLLTGQPIPDGPLPADFPPPATANPGVSQRTSWVVMKTLETDPRKAFQSVLEIKKALNLPSGDAQPAGSAAPGANVVPQMPSAPVIRQSGSAPIPPPLALGQAGKSGVARGGKSDTSRTTLLIILAVILLLCIALIAASALLFNTFNSGAVLDPGSGAAASIIHRLADTAKVVFSIGDSIWLV